MTQTEKIINHLKKHGSISTYDAFMKYRITRLSARIYDIRQMGYNIKAESKKNEDGTHYAVYRLEAE